MRARQGGTDDGACGHLGFAHGVGGGHTDFFLRGTAAGFAADAAAGLAVRGLRGARGGLEGSGEWGGSVAAV
ncbi:hypothetical protein D3C71_2105920 [compost metagenome]